MTKQTYILSFEDVSLLPRDKEALCSGSRLTYAWQALSQIPPPRLPYTFTILLAKKLL